MILDNDLSSSSFASSLAKNKKIKKDKGKGRRMGEEKRNHSHITVATCRMGREKRRK